jgi:ElaB/YqjD/DUF883 family membrane-anchored ribosome-binding protein
MNAKSAATLSHDEEQTDVQRVISGAEQLLSEASATGGEKAAELRGRAMQQLKALREKVATAQEVALDKGKRAARATDDYVHEHPWRIIAAAAGIGVAIGLLLNRR